MRTTAVQKRLVIAGVLAVVVAAAIAGLRHGSDEPDPYADDPLYVDTGPTTVSVVGKDVRILVANPVGYRTTLASTGNMQLRLYGPDRCLVVDRLGVEGTGRDAEIQASEPTDWYQPIWPPGTTVVQDGTRYGVRVISRVPEGVKAKPIEVTFWQGDYVGGAGSRQESRETYGLPSACIGAGLHQLNPSLDSPHEFTPPPEAVCPSPQAVGCE